MMDQSGNDSHGKGGIFLFWFGNDVTRRNISQTFFDVGQILDIGHYVDMIGRNQGLGSHKCFFKQSFFAQEVNKLFRGFIAGKWPEASAPSSTEDNHIEVGSEIR